MIENTVPSRPNSPLAHEFTPIGNTPPTFQQFLQQEDLYPYFASLTLAGQMRNKAAKISYTWYEYICLVTLRSKNLNAPTAAAMLSHEKIKSQLSQKKLGSSRALKICSNLEPLASLTLVAKPSCSFCPAFVFLTWSHWNPRVSSTRSAQTKYWTLCVNPLQLVLPPN